MKPVLLRCSVVIAFMTEVIGIFSDPKTCHKLFIYALEQCLISALDCCRVWAEQIELKGVAESRF